MNKKKKSLKVFSGTVRAQEWENVCMDNIITHLWLMLSGSLTKKIYNEKKTHSMCVYICEQRL